MSETCPAGAANASALSFAQQTPALESTPIPEPALNIVVQHCIEARDQRIRAELARGTREYDARKCGNQAYVRAMPNLAGLLNIQNFIACVAHGMMIDRDLFEDPSRLLYAAQVALTSIRSEAKSKPKS